MKRLTDKICFAITAAVFLVIAFLAGGFFESMRHPEIVQEQSITMRELKGELMKHQAVSLQIDDKWDLGFIPDKRYLACVGFYRRPPTKFQKDVNQAMQKAVKVINLIIAGAGDEGVRKTWE